MRVVRRVGWFFATISSSMAGVAFVAPEANRIVFPNPNGGMYMPQAVLHLSCATAYTTAVGFTILMRPNESRVFRRPNTLLLVVGGLLAWGLAYPVLFGLAALSRLACGAGAN